nr:MAG TPA: hypothetical protein [Caudoviricetes sp.]
MVFLMFSVFLLQNTLFLKYQGKKKSLHPPIYNVGKYRIKKI